MVTAFRVRSVPFGEMKTKSHRDMSVVLSGGLLRLHAIIVAGSAEDKAFRNRRGR
jgi:hypothetical protein